MTMPRLRISLAGSLGIVAVIAMGLAGMVSASRLWTAAAATVTLALLLTALLGACLLDGIDRAFWAGFALFGWSYIILVNWDWIGGQFGHDLTFGLSDLAEVAIPRPEPPVGIPFDPISMETGRQIRLGNFVQIGRMFLALAFGLLGGSIAQVFARRRRAAANAAEPARSDPPGQGVG
jgi:hypothetical protein